MFNYSKKVMEHFSSPQNAYKMNGANGEGRYGEPGCGDSLTIYIKVIDGVIEDISYLVYGCTASIATSSMISVMVKGKTIAEALDISEKNVIDSLDGLPEAKQHCSNMGVKALHVAINDYYLKRKCS